MKKEEYMRVGTTLYKVVNQPSANGGYEKKTCRMEQQHVTAGLWKELSCYRSQV